MKNCTEANEQKVFKNQIINYVKECERSIVDDELAKEYAINQIESLKKSIANRKESIRLAKKQLMWAKKTLSTLK